MFSNMAVSVVFSCKGSRTLRTIQAIVKSAAVHDVRVQQWMTARLMSIQVFPETERRLMGAAGYVASEPFVVYRCIVSATTSVSSGSEMELLKFLPKMLLCEDSRAKQTPVPCT